MNSISYPVLLEAQHTYSVPNVGWNQTALQEFIDSCYLLQMHKRSSPCCLNPYDFAHTIYSPCSPDKFIPTLQDQFKYLLCEVPYLPIFLLTVTLSCQKRLPLSALSQHALDTYILLVLKIFGLFVYFSFHDLFIFESLYMTYRKPSLNVY